jgi:hypothetical protein
MLFVTTYKQSSLPTLPVLVPSYRENHKPASPRARWIRLHARNTMFSVDSATTFGECRPVIRVMSQPEDSPAPYLARNLKKFNQKRSFERGESILT